MNPSTPLPPQARNVERKHARDGEQNGGQCSVDSGLPEQAAGYRTKSPLYHTLAYQRRYR
jgi:hypothetical protein